MDEERFTTSFLLTIGTALEAVSAQLGNCSKAYVSANSTARFLADPAWLAGNYAPHFNHLTKVRNATHPIGENLFNLLVV